MDEATAKQRLERQYKKQNDFNKQNYDRVSIMLPAGYREEVREIAKKQGKSLNGFVIEAIQEKIKNIE